MTKRKVKCSAADFALLTDGGAKRIADLRVAAEVDALDAGGLAFYLAGAEPPARRSLLENTHDPAPNVQTVLSASSLQSGSSSGS